MPNKQTCIKNIKSLNFTIFVIHRQCKSGIIPIPSIPCISRMFPLMIFFKPGICSNFYYFRNFLY